MKDTMIPSGDLESGKHMEEHEETTYGRDPCLLNVLNSTSSSLRLLHPHRTLGKQRYTYLQLQTHMARMRFFRYLSMIEWTGMRGSN